MEHIKIFDKTFKPYIRHDEIMEAIDKVAEKINNDFRNSSETPVILCVLNGSIVFTAELMQRLDFQYQLASIDTGGTIVKLDSILKEAGAARIKICTLLFKPDSYDKNIAIDYVAKEIPNAFIVGFGLDYDELGRGLKDIYVIDEE